MGLPFNRFLDFYLEKNYDALIKKEYEGGNVDILELIKAGDVLHTQYLDACGGNDNTHYLSVVGTIAKLEAKIERVKVIVEGLREYFDEARNEDLKQLGIRVKVRKDFLEEDLNRVLTDAKRFVIELNNKNNSIEDANKKSKEPDINMFYQVLSQKDARLTIYDIDTAMYCAIYREQREKYKALEKRNRDGRPD